MEIQVSFIVIPLRDQKSRMSVILRSINLLDGQFTQVSKVKPTKMNLSSSLLKKQDAFVKNIMQENAPKILKPKPTLKRKVGYSEEEISHTRTKLAAMAIDEEEVQDELIVSTGTAD